MYHLNTVDINYPPPVMPITLARNRRRKPAACQKAGVGFWHVSHAV